MRARIYLAMLIIACVPALAIAQYSGSPYEQTVQSCGASGSTVSSSARPGQKCPHCGVYWSGYEDGSSKKRGYSGLSKPKPLITEESAKKDSRAIIAAGGTVGVVVAILGAGLLMLMTIVGAVAGVMIFIMKSKKDAKAQSPVNWTSQQNSPFNTNY